MAIDSKLYKPGEVLLVNVKPNILGSFTLTSFKDYWNGVTYNRSYKAEFRVTTDNIFWTEWKEISDDNIKAIADNIDVILIIQIRYTRIGRDETGELEFLKLEINGEYSPVEFDAPTINDSIFNKVINKADVKAIESNLLKKLYFRGILPKFIERGENRSKEEDEDFISLWSSVSKFFGMILEFCKKFENFWSDFTLMREQLRATGLSFDEKTITLAEAQFLCSNTFDEIRKRGTNMIFKRKGEVLKDGTVIPINGEYIRYFRIEEDDEFLSEEVPNKHTGWNLGNASPLYRGTSNSIGLNKTRESTKDFESISDFVYSMSEKSLLYIKLFDKKKTLFIRCNGADSYCGLGVYGTDEYDKSKLYVIDPMIDYEITFDFFLDQGIDKVNLLFALDGFNAQKDKMTDAFVTPDGLEITDVFLNEPLKNFRWQTWYTIRGIIHSYSSANVKNIKTNIGYGNNLYFNSRFVKYILPKIIIYNTDKQYEYKSSIHIWNYKIRPLVRGTNILPLKDGDVNAYSLGFIESSRLFYILTKKNNTVSEEEAEEFVNKYLLPYNTTIINQMI